MAKFQMVTQSIKQFAITTYTCLLHVVRRNLVVGVEVVEEVAVEDTLEVM